MTSTINITGTVKTTTNGKVVIDVYCKDLPGSYKHMTGDVVEIGGQTYTITGHGKLFDCPVTRKTRVYLYTDAKPALVAINQPCRRCGTYCCGDCRAN